MDETDEEYIRTLVKQAAPFWRAPGFRILVRRTTPSRRTGRQKSCNGGGISPFNLMKRAAIGDESRLAQRMNGRGEKWDGRKKRRQSAGCVAGTTGWRRRRGFHSAPTTPTPRPFCFWGVDFGFRKREKGTSKTPEFLGVGGKRKTQRGVNGRGNRRGGGVLVKLHCCGGGRRWTPSSLDSGDARVWIAG